jgi:starch phosphorylase
MNAQQVSDLQRRGYRPADFINASPRLRNAIEAIERGDFSEGDGGMFAGLCHMLRNGDHFMTAADFDMYENAQRHVDLLWRDQNQWRRMALLNTANMGWFSSDRTIREYAEDIWSAPIQRLRQ